MVTLPSPEPPLPRLTSLPPLVLALAVAVIGCAREGAAPEAGGEPGYDDPQLVFWASLQELCGQAFEGRVVENVPPDDAFEGRIVMHVRSCDPGVVRIPFSVGEDRSRTWVLSTTSVGLRLKHNHRHEDGSEDEVSRYGGDTRGQGEPTRQEFYADAFTAELVPAAAANVWSVEIRPGALFAYALRREGTDRRFRVEFALTRPVAPPPPTAPIPPRHTSATRPMSGRLRSAKSSSARWWCGPWEMKR